LQTRSHILALLQGAAKDPDANNATILLKALQKTILFEKEVSNALQREYGTTFRDPSETKAEVTKPPMKTKSKSSDDDSISTNDGKAATEQEAVDPLLGVASSAFDNHMGPYIALEEQSMDEQLVVALEDRAVDTRGELPVFTTSTKLFIYIKGSITRCTALTKGNAFFLLYQAFQDSLRKYAQVLSSKLPPALPPKSGGVGGLNLPNVSFAKQEGSASAQPTYKVPQGEEVTVCHVIGTCEYCAETVDALQDLIRDTVDDQYKEKIDMMPQQEAFHEITAKAIRVLVTGLENRLEDAYRMMYSINWATFDEVGEESDYVRIMHREIQPYVTTARSLIPTSYFRSVCDKFAMAFANDFYEATIKLKTISEQGAQQLVLDLQILKTLFLRLPVLEKAPAGGMTSPRKGVPSGSTIAPAMYTKMVNKQFKKIEVLLKLTGTPIALLIDVFRDQWPGGTASDLQTVLSLKGLKRSDQATMLEKFGLDPATARKGATKNVTSATIVTERLQAVGQAAMVNSDLNQMRQKVDEFRKAFR
jgi:vacuolar protein sorting-associated protein 53